MKCIVAFRTKRGIHEGRCRLMYHAEGASARAIRKVTHSDAVSEGPERKNQIGRIETIKEESLHCALPAVAALIL